MKPLHTKLGLIYVGNEEELFRLIVQEIQNVAEKESVVALTGGSTPKAFYQWVIHENLLNATEIKNITWTVSDERWVPESSQESNFGNAKRQFLEPLGIPLTHQLAWPTDETPINAVAFLEDQFNSECPFDLCFLGMGDDCHTASLFPNSPLLKKYSTKNFGWVDVPHKGVRLTLTPQGIGRCRKIIVMVTGIKKRDAVKAIFSDIENVQEKPIQLLKDVAEKVIWLMDEDAAGAILPRQADRSPQG